MGLYMIPACTQVITLPPSAPLGWIMPRHSFTSTYKRWIAVELTAANGRMLYVPAEFAIKWPCPVEVISEKDAGWPDFAE